MEITKQMMKYSNVCEFKREFSAYRPTYMVGNDKGIDPLPNIISEHLQNYRLKKI